MYRITRPDQVKGNQKLVVISRHSNNSFEIKGMDVVDSVEDGFYKYNKDGKEFEYRIKSLLDRFEVYCVNTSLSPIEFEAAYMSNTVNILHQFEEEISKLTLTPWEEINLQLQSVDYYFRFISWFNKYNTTISNMHFDETVSSRDFISAQHEALSIIAL